MSLNECGRMVGGWWKQAATKRGEAGARRAGEEQGTGVASGREAKGTPGLPFLMDTHFPEELGSGFAMARGGRQGKKSWRHEGQRPEIAGRRSEGRLGPAGRGR